MKTGTQDFIHINPSEITTQETFGLMLDTISPRPIAFASTIDSEGNPNLAPFSFFNGFGANPPILVFSPSRRGRDNTTKHTYDNIKEVPEVCINVVTYDMVHQVSLASSDYPKGTSEFEKSGFTMAKSETIKPFRVKESPVQFECKVINVIETGDQGAAGNLVICEILKIHIDKRVMDESGKIDPHKLDLVGRLGGDYYVRVSGDAIFKVPKPTGKGIGIDALPESIRTSKVLTGNDLGQLGNVKSFPDIQNIKEHKGLKILSDLKASGITNNIFEFEIHTLAHSLIRDKKVDLALELLIRIHAG